MVNVVYVWRYKGKVTVMEHSPPKVWDTVLPVITLNEYTKVQNSTS